MKNRTQGILHESMLHTKRRNVAQVALKALDSMQKEKAAAQLLGLAAALITVSRLYDLNLSEMLTMAENMVKSDEAENATKDFAAIKTYIKNEWEL